MKRCRRGFVLIAACAALASPGVHALRSTTTNRFVWGKDLSGSVHGAAGVGGLVLIELDGDVYFPIPDGNGNIRALVDNTGTVQAEYEYGPFGEPVRASGPAAAANPMRFSTRYLDRETGHYCFGLRYYSPPLGTWLCRDPMGESGGANLYAYCRNDPVNSVDPVGQDVFIERRDQSRINPYPGVFTVKGENELILHLVLRYMPSSADTSPYSADEIRQRADEHRQILESDFNAARHTYVMMNPMLRRREAYSVRLMVHITTDPPELREIPKGLGLEAATQAFRQNLVREKRFFTTIEVARSRRGGWCGILVPGEAVATSSEAQFRKILMHELVAHGMNLVDEYRSYEVEVKEDVTLGENSYTKGTVQNAFDLYTDYWGREPPADSIMLGGSGATTFYNESHHNVFDAAFRDMCNNPYFRTLLWQRDITSGSRGDYTHWLDITDPWWQSQEELDYVREKIMGLR